MLKVSAEHQPALRVMREGVPASDNNRFLRSDEVAGVMRVDTKIATNLGRLLAPITPRHNPLITIPLGVAYKLT